MSPQQCRAARALLGLSRPQLSLLSQVGKNTIQAFEAGQHHANRSTVSKLKSAFENLSVSFTHDSEGVGVRRDFPADDLGGLAHEPEAEDDASPASADMAADDDSFLPITPAQARAARAFLGLSQTEAACLAKVGLSLIVAFETGMRTPRLNNLSKIRAMYEERGIKFVTVDGVPAVQALPAEKFAPARRRANREDAF